MGITGFAMNGSIGICIGQQMVKLLQVYNKWPLQCHNSLKFIGIKSALNMDSVVGVVIDNENTILIVIDS